MELALQTLEAAAFAPYGSAWRTAGGAGRPINAGTSRRTDLPAALDLQRAGGRPALALFEAAPQGLAGPWRQLERHRHGSQTFVPLAAGRWVVLVARGRDAPVPATLAAFEAGPLDAVTLHPGTWHHPLVALDAGRFLVLERAGAGEDCDVLPLPVPVTLVR